ncbi:type II secretion system protein [Pseudomonas aeruginosa]|nr:type II secretion system protein [Pseudomonas aeruginosa]
MFAPGCARRGAGTNRGLARGTGAAAPGVAGGAVPASARLPPGQSRTAGAACGEACRRGELCGRGAGPRRSGAATPGPRPARADGRLTLGWLEASALASLEQAVQRLRLDVREVQAAPFLLPLRDDAWVAGEWDGHLLLRRSLSDAVVHPLPEQGLAEVPQELRLFWLGERPAWRSAALERAEALDEALRWSGPASPWGLALKAPATSAGNGTWKMPLFCAALALLVWVAGLNLYAGQLAGQGQSLQRQSSQRVQQAFPELPVVLDPLRQARERRDAYLAGKADGDAAAGLAALLHGAGEAMPFLAGRLQRLDYHAGELDLELLPGPPGGDAAAWQGELGKHGLQADASDKGWQVRAMEAPPAPAAGAADSGTAEAAADEDE